MTNLAVETTAHAKVPTAGLLHGVLLVARHEFRVRLRTGRWRWLLGVWVTVVAVFTALLHLALVTTETAVGTPLFGGLMLFVLALVLIVSPALTAQSINGDRERGTLATLQVTRLSPVQIAAGKLVAAWGVGLAALALTVPFVLWAVAQGGVGVVRAVAVLAVVALLIGVVCAVSQALSALLSRSITSALMSYVVMFALTIGTLIAFGRSCRRRSRTRTGRWTRSARWAGGCATSAAAQTPRVGPASRCGRTGWDSTCCSAPVGSGSPRGGCAPRPARWPRVSGWHNRLHPAPPRA